jgi:hypothetical protein
MDTVKYMKVLDTVPSQIEAVKYDHEPRGIQTPRKTALARPSIT